MYHSVQFSSVQSLSHLRLFATPSIIARQASLSITNTWSLPKLTPIESVMPSSHLILCRPLLLLPPVMPDVRIPEREEGRPPRQCNSQKRKFIADSSQGSCRIQRSGAGSESPEPESPEPKLLHKFIGWAHAIGSWFKRVGYKFAKQFHWSNTLKTFVHAWGFPGGFCPVPNWQTAVSVKLIGCIHVAW